MLESMVAFTLVENLGQHRRAPLGGRLDPRHEAHAQALSHRRRLRMPIACWPTWRRNLI